MAFFHGVGLKILFLPVGEHRGLLDVLLTLNPNFFHWIFSTVKKPEIAFLPNVPDEKSRYELPDFVEKGIWVGVCMPILNGF